MKDLIDFDREYMRFAASWIKQKGDVKDDAIETELNNAMKAWLAEKSDALGGMTPDEYFARMHPSELVDLISKYSKTGLQVPEPLYRQITGRPGCADALRAMALDKSETSAARSTALRLMCDMNGEGLMDMCVELVASGACISQMAADWLISAGYPVVEKLMARYYDADEDSQETMLDIMCYYPGIDLTSRLLERRLLSDHERRAQHAAMAARLGDPELVEPLIRLSQLSEISYYDYKEIVNAIDSLGGDPGPERQFYGDPDYELMRDPDISLPEDWKDRR